MSIKKIERLPNINEDGGVGIVIDINDSMGIKIYYKIIIIPISKFKLFLLFKIFNF